MIRTTILTLALIAPALASARHVPITCVGNLIDTELNANVPTYFKNAIVGIKSRASTPGAAHDVFFSIGDDTTRVVETYEASRFSGTKYPLAVTARNSSGGFYYVTYERPPLADEEPRPIRAEFVYAQGALNEPELIRARFALLCVRSADASRP